MNFLENFKDIHTFLFDVDGVLTNNEILILDDGKLLRKMNVRDGYGLRKAVQQGYRVGIITGGKSAGVMEGLKKLGIRDIYAGIADKTDAYLNFIRIHDIDPSGVLYMGDDLPDYLPMCRVGLPACPKDAVAEIRKVARYISPFKGGEGCVRDVIEKVLKIQGNWPVVKSAVGSGQSSGGN